MDVENRRLQELEMALGARLELQDGLNILEAVVIAVAEPRLNRQGGAWAGAAQCLQYWRDRNHDEEGAEEQ